jgi:hypothetical protein
MKTWSRRTLGTNAVGHVSRDATAIEAPERPAAKPAARRLTGAVQKSRRGTTVPGGACPARKKIGPKGAIAENGALLSGLSPTLSRSQRMF